MAEPVAISAADALRKAKRLIDTFGWPTYSPHQALTAVEKTMAGQTQKALMWDIATRTARERRKDYSGLHPVIEINVQEGQTKAGIDEFMLDCIDQAENHPLHGTD